MQDERLGPLATDQLGAHGIVPAGCIEIFVHAMMRPKPVALTGMTSEHRQLFVMLPGDIDHGGRLNNLSAVGVCTSQGITIIHVWNSDAFDHRRGRCVGTRRQKAALCASKCTCSWSII